jgi:CheY-like chemotaxis protein
LSFWTCRICCNNTRPAATGWRYRTHCPKLISPMLRQLGDPSKRAEMGFGTMTYRILVVDDSKLARMAVAKALSAVRPDWTRVEASGAPEALSLAKANHFDVAVLDFNMPERDGLHLAMDLKAIDPDMVLAVISANHQKEVVDRARAIGAAFLGKPLTEQALRDFLAEIEPKLKADKA